MKATLLTSSPDLLASANVSRRLTHRSLFLVPACAVLFMMILNVFFRETYEGDEGFYGVTALNMLQSKSYILRPSYFPAGDFLAEKEAFAHPPINSYLYAVSIWLGSGSLAGPELLNVLALAALLYFAFRLLCMVEVRAAWFTVLLLAASPAILKSYSLLEAEPLMTTFGIIGLFCVHRAGFETGQRHWFFLGGLALGVSFALKLWLCGPLVLAAATALTIRAWQTPGVWRAKLLALGCCALGAVIPAALHLLATAWFYPQDVGYWLKSIYFGVFTSSGLSGAKLSGAGTSTDWMHPLWYYAASLYRDNFFLFPIILLGLGPVFRDARLKGPLLWSILAGAAGVLPLSLLKVKEPLYVLACAVFLYFLAGICLAAFVRQPASKAYSHLRWEKLATLALFGLLLLFPLAYARGIQPARITGSFVLVHSLVFTSFLAAYWWNRLKTTPALLEWTVYGACALAVTASFAHDCLTRRPRDEIIARLIKPNVQNNSPGALSLIASNFKSYQFYSFRRGCYWEELSLREAPDTVLTSPAFSHVRAFILDPEDQQLAEIKPWVSWLETHAAEKTRELDAEAGSVSGFRVFVR